MQLASVPKLLTCSGRAQLTRWPEEATDGLLVEFESIRNDQGKTLEIHPPRKVVKQRVSVPVASPSRHRRWPEPRPDLDRNEDPTRRLLVARERANLVGLKLFGSEASDPCVVELAREQVTRRPPTLDCGSTAYFKRVRLFWNGGFGMSHSGKGSSHLTRLRWRPLTGTTLPSA